MNAIGLLAAFGTGSADFQTHNLSELLHSSCAGGSKKPYTNEAMNSVIAAMHGINPRDEIEAMLASQMVATHSAAIRLMQQLRVADTIQQQDSAGNMATKLMRLYTAQLEALNRYRGKGQQKMTVEHVHIGAGGQAIIGNVTHPEGGGVNTKTEEQPHAKTITHAPEQTMPCQNPQGQPMPVPSDA